jgi:hypothetical protein
MKKLILLLLFIPMVSFGQTKDGAELCLAAQKYSKSFITDKEAENALGRILSVIGGSKNFTLQSCDEINNALAITYNGNRYILYDKKFMQLIAKYSNNWSSMFILAHEVGHHINGHTRDAALTEVLNETSLEKQRLEELEADKFAGFVLAKLGANLKQSLSAINLISPNGDDRYSTHPNKEKRIEAVRVGYKNGKPIVVSKSNVNKSPISISQWQKNNNNSDNPFEVFIPEAYTIGSKKPSTSNNLSLPPKLTIKKNGNKLKMIISNLNIPVEGKWSDIYYGRFSKYNNYIKKYISKEQIAEIGYAKEVSAMRLEFVSQGHYSYSAIQRIIMQQIKIALSKLPQSYSLVTENISTEIVFDNEEPLIIKEFTDFTLKEPHSLLKPELDISSNTIIALSFYIKTTNKIIDKIKNGSIMYVRFKNLDLISGIRSKTFARDNFQSKYGWGTLSTEYSALQRDFIYSPNENPENSYYQFSLSGSSSALDFID